MSTTNCLMAEVRLIRELDRLWMSWLHVPDEGETFRAYVDARDELERRLTALDAVVAGEQEAAA